jgi:hypothetical protein
VSSYLSWKEYCDLFWGDLSVVLFLLRGLTTITCGSEEDGGFFLVGLLRLKLTLAFFFEGAFELLLWLRTLS